ncbi:MULTISPECIES: GntR family transcriptional regulator [unclassified Blastococcus]
MVRVDRVDVSRGRLLFDSLRERIVEGAHPPGSRLSVEDITSEFGVSKQPVMDALRRLETLGLVEIVPQSGCRIRSYSTQEAHDFFTVFASFEGEIAAAAAERHDESEMAALDETLDALHLVEQTRDHSKRGREYFARNAAFHGQIHAMARSPLVADLSRRMWYLSDFLMYSRAGATRIADSVVARNHDHDLIRTALRDRNAIVAEAAMKQHILSITSLFTPEPPGRP